jgi:hypothetical protein
LEDAERSFDRQPAGLVASIGRRNCLPVGRESVHQQSQQQKIQSERVTFGRGFAASLASRHVLIPRHDGRQIRHQPQPPDQFPPRELNADRVFRSPQSLNRLPLKLISSSHAGRVFGCTFRIHNWVVPPKFLQEGGLAFNRKGSVIRPGPTRNSGFDTEQIRPDELGDSRKFIVEV